MSKGTATKEMEGASGQGGDPTRAEYPANATAADIRRLSEQAQGTRPKRTRFTFVLNLLPGSDRKLKKVRKSS